MHSEKRLPSLSPLVFLLLRWIIGSLGCHQKNWWVHFATESFKFTGNVSFFTDYKHTLFLNGTTNSISAARRYDKLLLDPNNNYVLRGKKHPCYENFAVLRLRSKIRKLKSHQNYFCSLGAKLKFRKSFLTKMQN